MNKKFTTNDVIAIVAAVVSLFSLVSSIRSCQISNKVLELSLLEYNSNRAIVLKGDVQDINSNIKITPHDSSFLLQELHYQFPAEVGAGRKYASAPDFLLTLTSEVEYFKQSLAARYRDKLGKIVLGENARLPFLMDTYSSVKGVGYRDQSIYTLNFKFEVSGSPELAPKIVITGISFGTRIERNQNPVEFLEKIWSESKTK